MTDITPVVRDQLRKLCSKSPHFVEARFHHRRSRSMGCSCADKPSGLGVGGQMQEQEGKEALQGAFYSCDGQGARCGTCGPLDGAYCFQEIVTLTLSCAPDEYCSDISPCSCANPGWARRPRVGE